MTDDQVLRDVSLPGMLPDMVLASEDVNEFLEGLVTSLGQQIPQTPFDA